MSARRRTAPATRFLIGAIFFGLFVQWVTGALTDPRKLVRLGAIVREWILQDGEWWRLLSAMFLHGDGTIPLTAAHAGMNLWALFQLGRLYELMFGTKRFTIIYFAAGIVASLTSLFLNDGASVGASGAIFGIAGAFIVSVLRSPKWRHERAARSIVNQLAFWTLANIAIGAQFPQIDLAAHIGGFVAGLTFGALWPHRVQPPRPAESVIDVMPYDK